jgi:hypothetical protein
MNGWNEFGSKVWAVNGFGICIKCLNMIWFSFKKNRIVFKISRPLASFLSNFQLDRIQYILLAFRTQEKRSENPLSLSRKIKQMWGEKYRKRPRSSRPRKRPHATPQAEEFVSCFSRPSLHLPLHLHRRPELVRPGSDRPLPSSSGKWASSVLYFACDQPFRDQSNLACRGGCSDPYRALLIWFLWI